MEIARWFFWNAIWLFATVTLAYLAVLVAGSLNISWPWRGILSPSLVVGVMLYLRWIFRLDPGKVDS